MVIKKTKLKNVKSSLKNKTANKIVKKKSSKKNILPQKFLKQVDRIISLEIQGAQNIAEFATDQIAALVKEYKDSENLFTILSNAKKALFESRSTEPAMRNALNYILMGIEHSTVALHPQAILKRYKETKDFFKHSDDYIAEVGSRRIRNGMRVYTHCHSSTVMEVLKRAYDKGIHFEVCNTETRPRFQGRKTAKELADYGIKVHHFVDSAARMALKKCDIALIGCDAITESHLYNKVGTATFAEIAARYDIPVFSCTTSWKFDPLTLKGFDEEIEERSPDEVWEKPPKNVFIYNPAFDKVHKRLITGIISELGILSFQNFITEVEDKYSWMK